MKSLMIKLTFYLILPFYFIWYFFIRLKDKNVRSTSTRIQRVIDLIDEGIGSFGTFNSDHEEFILAIGTLSKYELIKLHKDFGKVYYNNITGTFSLFPLFDGYTYEREYDLNSLFLKELDSNQLKRMKSMYKIKSLDFPLLV